MAKPPKNKWETEEYVNPQEVYVAISLYNDIRTTLEDDGWTTSEDEHIRSTPGYWWVHPDHGGTHSMSAAHGQWRLDVEARKNIRHELMEKQYVDSLAPQKG